MWNNWNSHILLVEHKIVQPFWKRVWHFMIKLKQTFRVISKYFTPQHLHKRSKSKWTLKCKQIFATALKNNWAIDIIEPVVVPVAKLCPTLCHPMGGSKPRFPILHHLLEFVQTQVYRVSDAIQPSHPLSTPSPFAFSPSYHQGLFQRVSSLYQVAKGLELQLQHQSFQWIFRVGFL